MRGTIIHWDPAEANGIISDASGRRLPFGPADWRAQEPPLTGRDVDFELRDDRPSDIYILPASGPFVPGGSADAGRQADTYGVISLVCAGVALFLGPFGFIAAIPAIIFGKKAKEQGAGSRDRTGYTLGTVGLILGWIMVALSVAILLFFLIVFGVIFSTVPR